MYVGRRNQMVVKNQAVTAQWAQVDVVLQRRADLIPNLVETVKGYAAQEQTVFGDIAKARSALLGAQTPADRIAANGAAGRRAGPPAGHRRELSAAQVQREFPAIAGRTGRHAKIASRSSGAVTTRPLQDYNTYIGLFPNDIFASMGRLQAEQRLFHGHRKPRREVPKVEFSGARAANAAEVNRSPSSRCKVDRYG